MVSQRIGWAARPIVFYFLTLAVLDLPKRRRYGAFVLLGAADMWVVRDHWQLVSWIPVPIRVCLLVLGVLACVVLLIPLLLRSGGRVLEVSARPMAEVCTLPEYVWTTARRKKGLSAHPAAFVYDRFLGSISSIFTRFGGWLQRTVGKKRRFPWVATCVISGVVMLLWFVQAAAPAGSAKEALHSVTQHIDRADNWIGSGSLLGSDSNNVVWSVDAVTSDGSQVYVAGWTLDFDDPDQSLGVVVTVNGEKSELVTDALRDDVNQLYGISGSHGFADYLPLGPGENSVCLYTAATIWNPTHAMGCYGLPASSS